jgi:hypothetical protein
MNVQETTAWAVLNVGRRFSRERLCGALPGVAVVLA